MVTPKCPSCRIDLERKVVRGRDTEVDRCPKCGGVWFGDGELAQVIGAAAVQRLSIPPKAAARENRWCPRCASTLATFPYPGTMTVIDACRECGGVWLDAGELDEIAKVRRERKVVCPNCGHEQPGEESCAKCGIIFSKFSRTPAPARAAAAPQPATTPPAAAIGVKETLIGFINSSLESLWGGIRR